jgi:hypothetical protein
VPGEKSVLKTVDLKIDQFKVKTRFPYEDSEQYKRLCNICLVETLCFANMPS